MVGAFLGVSGDGFGRYRKGRLGAGESVAGLTGEELHRLNPGFDAEHVVTFTIDPPVLYEEGQTDES
jgi:hypothetical protein